MQKKIILLVSLAIIATIIAIIFIQNSKLENNNQDYNIILIVIDTLRQDHLGVYGYERNTSPNIDNFAKKAAVYNNAYSVTYSTKPTVTSIFTGVMPHVHKTYRHEPNISNAHVNSSWDTLAEKLMYDSFGYYSNPTINKMFGFGQGFEQYEYDDNDENVTRYGINVIQNQREPFFLYLHYSGPHHPIEDPRYYTDLFGPVSLSFDYMLTIGTTANYGKFNLTEQDKQSLNIMYDRQIRLIDDQFQMILDELDKQGLMKNTIIIFTSDHGEQMGEHDDFWGHGQYLYEEAIKIPLIIWNPNEQRKEINEYVSILSLHSAILNQNFSLPTSNHVIVQGRLGSVVIKDNEKLFFKHHILYDEKPVPYAFFNLTTDPYEMNNSFPKLTNQTIKKFEIHI